jgi:hypothetical protein
MDAISISLWTLETLDGEYESWHDLRARIRAHLRAQRVLEHRASPIATRICVVGYLRSEGHTEEWIAKWLGRGLRTVERDVATLKAVISETRPPADLDAAA